MSDEPTLRDVLAKWRDAALDGDAVELGYLVGLTNEVLDAGAAGPERAPLDVERVAEIVSDSLAASTGGTDWAEAPEPSDEPGSPYVLRLTNEILARLGLAAAGTDRPASDLHLVVPICADCLRPVVIDDEDGDYVHLDELPGALDGPEPVAGAASTGDER